MTHDGKQTALPVTDPTDEAGAWEAFKSLVSRASKEKLSVRPEPLSALVAEYLDSISHRISPWTRKGYETYLRRFVALFGNRAAGDVDPVDVEKRAMGEAWSDSNRANYLMTVQPFMRWAGRKDFSLHRPAKESRGAEAVITPEVQRLILREATGDFHELCRFLWATGARPMEAAKLLVVSIDWASATATLKEHKMKRKGKRRVLYLSTEALAIAQAQATRYESGHLFRGLGGKPFTRRAIVGRFLRISKKIGHEATAYGYRHSYATRALAAGIPDTHVAALLGHTSTAMLAKHYSHVNANGRLLRETAERIAG